MGLFSSISKAIKKATSGSSSSSSSRSSGSSNKSSSGSYGSNIKQAMNNYGGSTSDSTYQNMASDRYNKIMSTDWQAKINASKSEAEKKWLTDVRNEKLGMMGGTEINPSTTFTTQTQDPQSPQYGDYDIQSKIDALNEAKRQSTINGLTKAKENALSSLDERKSSLEPYYYNKKNQAAAQSDVGSMNFAQYMAGRGVTGNSAAMPEMYRNAGLQNQIGALDQQQASDVASIEKDKSNVETNYQSDIAAAIADAEATKLQNYIAQMNADRSYNTDKTATAKSDYANTIGAFSDNYKAEINKIDGLINAGNTHDSDGVSLQYKRKLLDDARNQKIAEQQAAAAKAEQQDLQNQIALQNLELRQKQTDYQTNKPYYKPGSSKSGGLTYSQALAAYKEGIETPEVLSILGLSQ